MNVGFKSIFLNKSYVLFIFEIHFYTTTTH